jgi:beta-galactosidase
MRRLLEKSFVTVAFIVASGVPGACRARAAAPLPKGVSAVWDVEKAYRRSTPTRERMCINGLWRWQPADGEADAVPAEKWGYFKVPGCWPGITDYMQKDCQTVHAHQSWKHRNLRSISGAWYQREVTIPSEWAGRRITAIAEYVNSYATIYLDGREMGAIVFPGGELDITAGCRPAARHVLTVFVTAMPLKGVMLSYSDTASAREVKGLVARRGLCGDVYLVSTPMGARIADVKVNTSVRKYQITFDAALDGLATDVRYALRARIMNDGRNVGDFTSKAFRADELKEGRIAFTEDFKPEKLWDIHTPQNAYQLNLSLLGAGGKVLDVGQPVRFGFREFWIDGRDFFLNGTRIFLSSVPLDNAQVGAAWATYGAARESLERLKSFGINFVYAHNYGCEPGSHLSFEEILRASDDVGMLVALSQPHFAHYDWEAPDADETNGYARHAEFYVRVAGNHPSVVFYSMSHNATGYSEDMNPDMIDGIQNPRDSWALRNSKRASRAEAIVAGLDPGRIVYHHASGNLGPMHTSNFYANFAPIQEMSDWFEHWATAGVKPLFTCEYSVPFPWDWTMYRGWYKGERSFGSAKVPWEFCLAEWNAQFFGDEAFRISEMEKKNLRWEAGKFRAGSLWHRWDYPHVVGSSSFAERQPVYAMYFTDNWRAFRTWGVSANSPWNHGHYWTLRDGVDKGREEFQVDWENLQRPGLSPDYVEQRYERVDLAFDRSDWIPTIAAQALIRNNQPLLAYIAGGPGSFTSKDHNFYPGETVKKQLIVINNSRETVTCNCEWSLGLPQPVTGRRKVTVPTGQQERTALSFELPTALPTGKYKLSATFDFSNGQTRTDSFLIHVMPRPQTQAGGKIGLFDPKRETAKLLRGMGIPYRLVDANTSLSAYDTLIVGKSALTVNGPAPDIARVRHGLKVLMFEQTSDVLEKRFGFRTAEYGLRGVFKRVPDHPILAGIEAEHLRNWRGEATTLPTRLKYEMRPRYGPTVRWCGIPVTRLWRCGNRGNVASVLIEKPARGDFLPILDGGYSLQYSPLVEYREGKGMLLFCQMDVTGRTEDDPAAQTLALTILKYVSAWEPAPRREVIYIGDPAGRQHFESAGVSLTSYDGPSLSADQVLVVGPGWERKLATDAAAITDWLNAGGSLLAIGLDEQQANAFLPLKVRTKQAEHIATYFEPFSINSLLAGVGPADVHSREPRRLPLVSEGMTVIGDGILAKAENLNVVLCQFAPWQFEYKKLYNLKRTFRRTSYLLTRLLANMGGAGETPLLNRFGTPVDTSKAEKRWLEGLYMDLPEEWDDPYRFFRW